MSPFILFRTITAGIFASLVSHVAVARFLYPKLVKRLASSSAKAPFTPSVASVAAAKTGKDTARSAISSSLGASGAVYACLTVTALAFPDTEVALLFFPAFLIPTAWGVGGLVTLDIIGVLRGWK